MQSGKGNVPDAAGHRAKMTSVRSNPMDHGQTLRPALGGRILPALLLAAQPRLEILNGKNVFSSQLLRRYVQSHLISYSLRLTNIDIHKIFSWIKAIMYKKTSNISIFSCITKP
jgi:hypothetical protein